MQKTLAPDYTDFVPESDEMNLEAIERKLKAAAYSSSTEFIADISRIVKNAVAYNTPGHGRFGGPGAKHSSHSVLHPWLGTLVSPRALHLHVPDCTWEPPQPLAGNKRGMNTVRSLHPARHFQARREGAASGFTGALFEPCDNRRTCRGDWHWCSADIIQWAQQMRNAVREELADIAEKIEHADALVEAEDAGGADGWEGGNADEDGIADVAADGGGGGGAAEPATEMWVQCSACQKWVPPPSSIHPLFFP